VPGKGTKKSDLILDLPKSPRLLSTRRMWLLLELLALSAKHPSPRMARRQSQDPTVLAWLRAAQPGYIDVTTGPESGNCERSYKGAWRLNFTESRSVASSTAACLDKCDRCANCNYISVSSWERDCSWFMQRNTRPSAPTAGFLSGPSRRRLNTSLAASVLTGQGRHFVKAMFENPAVGHHKITQCHERSAETAMELPLRQRPHPRAEVTSEVTQASVLGLGFNLQGAQHVEWCTARRTAPRTARRTWDLAAQHALQD